MGRAQRGKFNKADIGSPTNFKHVTHVGFNAVPSFDGSSEMDLKRLFKMAGVKKEHLQDPEVSNKIFSVLEKAGGLESVRKQTRRMTSVERPGTRTRLRSLSSSSLTPLKRQNCLEQDSPHVAKIAAILERGPTLGYLPSLSKQPPPLETPPPSSHLPSMRPLPPMPPYLDELSQSFSPTVNLPARHCSKKGSLPTKNSMKMPPPSLPVGKYIPAETGRHASPQTIPDHPCPDSKMNMVSSLPSLPNFDISTNTTNCIPAHFPPSIPCVEPPIKLGDVPSPPPLSLSANVNLETLTPCNPEDCSLSTDLVSAAIPPPPPLLEFGKTSLENPLSNGSELQFISPAKKSTIAASKTQEVLASSKEPEQQTNPAIYLDQIKQGVQLKSVAQTVKAENTNCSYIVQALMDVIKRRHKAIQSSDEDEVEEDCWED